MKKKKEQIPSEHEYDEIRLNSYRNYTSDVNSINKVNQTLELHHQSNLCNVPLTTKLKNEPKNLCSIKNFYYSKKAIKSIILKNVYFRYSEKQEWTLNCLQMEIPFGRIYSLLGDSGSGKTTLIKIIIGLLKPASGCIKIFGCETISQINNCDSSFSTFNNNLSRLTIGYQPSELALYEEMTIYELLEYFGKLYLMSNEKIKLRIKEITSQLKLKLTDQPISTLSKSKKYCISLACAIIHDPSLLICDELITSIDPELKKIISAFLKELAENHHIAILITTSHFDDVQRFSHLVGFLQKGKLLAENSPEFLFSNYNSNSLEKVYSRLCRLDRSKIRSTIDEVFLEIKQKVDTRINQLDLQSSEILLFQENHLKRKYLSDLSMNMQLDIIQQNFVWLKLFLTLLLSNFNRLIRKCPVLLAFELFVPIYKFILFYLAFGRDPYDLFIGVVNDDYKETYGRKFIESIDNYFIKKIHYENFNDAILDLKRGRLTSVMYIGDQFSNLISGKLKMNKNFSEKNFERSNIFLYSDLTNKFITNTIEKSLTKSFRFFVNQLIISDANNSRLNFFYFPIKFENAIHDEKSIHLERNTNCKFNVSGLIVNILFSTNFYFTCIHFIKERKCSMLEKQFMAKISSTQIVIAFIITQLTITFIQISLIFLVLNLKLFDLIIVNSSYLLILLLLLLVSLMAIEIGIFFSSFFQQTQIVLLVTFISFINQIIISGTIWPIQSSPYLIRYLSILLNPTTLPSQTLENLLFRSSLSIKSGYIYCIIWCCFIIFNIKNFKFINYFAN